MNILVRSTILVLLFLGTFTLQAQPKFKFEKKTQKFEKVKTDTTLGFDFFFLNQGDQPLIITEIKVACTCTKYFYPKAPIPPGQRDKIHVTFDTEGKIGYQDRTLLIYSNASASPTKIRFRGTVDDKHP